MTYINDFTINKNEIEKILKDREKNESIDNTTLNPDEDIKNTEVIQIKYGDSYIDINKVTDKKAQTYDVAKEKTENMVPQIRSGINSTIENIKKIYAEDGVVQAAAYIANSAIKGAGELVETITKYLGDTCEGFLGQDFAKALGSIGSIIRDNTTPYKDGIEETQFGRKMEDSWFSSNKTGFLNKFESGSTQYKINVLASTPLDPGGEMDNIYGQLILGAPFLFGQMNDPGNRTLLNTFAKDNRILSLTPGLPKYNGGSYTKSAKDDQYSQTKDASEMLAYITKNNLDEQFNSKDKRYYTFDAKYAQYYQYLESMLNPIYLKLGLGTDGENTFNIFSFFNINKTADKYGSINASGYETLKPQYHSSLGFFVEGDSMLSESISNSQTQIGGQLQSRTNGTADDFQQLNYLTGMGTSGQFNNFRRNVGIGTISSNNLRNLTGQTFNTAGRWRDAMSSKIMKVLAFGAGAAIDIAKFQTENDFSQIWESFAVTNGMKVMYPELWSDSTFSKQVSFTYNFYSPYGDPASIFKYVYVPFAALLCFAMPRQAADNGYVSPFFVRASVPGYMTSDLALISDMTWQRGGPNNLWTKDGLPRAISGQITIQDLYPYLSMTKRYQFLSANPSYTVWLDSLVGMNAVYDENETDPMNQYWRQMINKASGLDNASLNGQLWNRYQQGKMEANRAIGNQGPTKINANTNMSQLTWMTRIQR